MRYRLPANYGIVEIEYEGRIPFDESTSYRQDKSKNLFLQHLSPRERGQFNLRQSITIMGNNGGLYEHFMTGHECNILDLKARFLWCLVIDRRFGCPFWDHILAQKLLIEANERYFRERARRFSFECITLPPAWTLITPGHYVPSGFSTHAIKVEVP